MRFLTPGPDFHRFEKIIAQVTVPLVFSSAVMIGHASGLYMAGLGTGFM